MVLFSLAKGYYEKITLLHYLTKIVLRIPVTYKQLEKFSK